MDRRAPGEGIVHPDGVHLEMGHTCGNRFVLLDCRGGTQPHREALDRLAQSLRVLSRMDDDEVRDVIAGLLQVGPDHVIQELVESATVTFDALDTDDPDDPRAVHKEDARVKLSPFYVAGKLSDIRFVASNAKYAVNDEDFVCGVVRH